MFLYIYYLTKTGFMPIPVSIFIFLRLTKAHVYNIIEYQIKLIILHR